MSERYTLYQYPSCSFCARVRAFLERRGLDIPLRDTQSDPEAFRELLAGGGRATVPCLKIEHDDGRVEWLYESADIIDYLDRKAA